VRADAPAPREPAPDGAPADLLARTVDTYGWAL
jgi:hypothetical protein